MFSDLYGRDIRDRLKWQHKLQTSLFEKIPVPKIIEYFQTIGTKKAAPIFALGAVFPPCFARADIKKTSQLAVFIWSDYCSVAFLSLV